MWLDRYNTMSSIDKERFSELANELLNRNYIIAYNLIFFKALHSSNAPLPIAVTSLKLWLFGIIIIGKYILLPVTAYPFSFFSNV